LTLRIEARTGLRMETGLAISRLNAAAWQELELEQLGRLDPNAAGPDTDPAWHAPMIREAVPGRQHLCRDLASRRLSRRTAPDDDWFYTPAAAERLVPVRPVRQGGRRFQKAERLRPRESSSSTPDSLRADCTKSRAMGRGPLVSRPPGRRPSKDGSLHLDLRAAVYGKLGREARAPQGALARVLRDGSPMREW